MIRKTIRALLVTLALASLHVADAQQPKRIAKIGVLVPSNPESCETCLRRRFCRGSSLSLIAPRL
jgi:hypothetical protein